MYALEILLILASVGATTVFAAPTSTDHSHILRVRAPPWLNEHVNSTFTFSDGNVQSTETAAIQFTGPGGPAGTSTLVPTSSTDSPSSAPATIGSNEDWFDVANKWRLAGGHEAFKKDATLVANAQRTADESVDGLIHKLFSGTSSQVLAPGDSSNFESVYVGGWLCELPNSPGLNGICATASNGWNHEGQTGHAEILMGDYKNIGCALGGNTGVWACDLA